MSGPDLSGLKDIARLLHQRELARLAPILESEARIRADLARLDAVTQSARASLQGLSPATLTGSDALWNTWVERQRADLQSRLALVLARKADEIDALRRSFGRKRALDTLSEAQAIGDRRDRQRRAAVSLGEIAALKSGRS